MTAVLVDLAVLLRADFAASYVWRPATHRYQRVVAHNMDPANLARYDAWYQFCDPMTHQLRALRRASYVEQVIPRREMLKTEFFNDFLARDGLDHGINMFVADQGRDLGDFRIWRARARPEFGSREIDLLNALEPFLRRAMRRSGDACGGLTPREIEVARLAADGCTDRDIARRLGISFGTVRTHLSRVLEKRGCANRVELAALFGRRRH
jgi:DNA-binding CsgD family transcriptional regulator